MHLIKTIQAGLLCLIAWAAQAHAETSNPVATKDPPLAAATAHALDGMAPAGHWAARLTLLRNGYD